MSLFIMILHDLLIVLVFQIHWTEVALGVRGTVQEIKSLKTEYLISGLNVGLTYQFWVSCTVFCIR